MPEEKNNVLDLGVFRKKKERAHARSLYFQGLASSNEPQGSTTVLQNSNDSHMQRPRFEYALRCYRKGIISKSTMQQYFDRLLKSGTPHLLAILPQES